MATETLSVPKPLVITDDLKQMLHLQEAGDEYVTQSAYGVEHRWKKSEVVYPWQFLQGILAGGPDPLAKHEAEKQRELAAEQRHGWF